MHQLHARQAPLKDPPSLIRNPRYSYSLAFVRSDRFLLIGGRDKMSNLPRFDVEGLILGDDGTVKVWEEV